MQIKTLKGAMTAAERTIKKFFGEEINKKEELNKLSGIIHTKYSIFLVYFVEEVDKKFKSTFPEIAKQIMWDEGIRVSKKSVIDFLNTPNGERKKLSLVFVLKDGEILQISPISLMNFCEITNLEIEDKGVYYFFPTIFLKKLGGKTTPKEQKTRNRLSLVSQINSLEEFNDEDMELAATFRDFDVDFFGEVIRTLQNIEQRLESIENYLKRRKV
jgi:hypothetical protein